MAVSRPPGPRRARRRWSASSDFSNRISASPNPAGFSRLIRVAPDARMILVGEAHPELPLSIDDSRRWDLSAHVRHIGFAPIEDFNGYLARLRHRAELAVSRRSAKAPARCCARSEWGRPWWFPTSARSANIPTRSASKLRWTRAKRIICSSILNLLVSRPEVAQALGARARQWVERECNWETVAQRYARLSRSGDRRERMAAAGYARGTVSKPESGRRSRRIHRRAGPGPKTARALTSKAT